MTLENDQWQIFTPDQSNFTYVHYIFIMSIENVRVRVTNRKTVFKSNSENLYQFYMNAIEMF